MYQTLILVLNYTYMSNHLRAKHYTVILQQKEVQPISEGPSLEELVEADLVARIYYLIIEFWPIFQRD